MGSNIWLTTYFFWQRNKNKVSNLLWRPVKNSTQKSRPSKHCSLQPLAYTHSTDYGIEKVSTSSWSCSRVCSTARKQKSQLKASWHNPMKWWSQKSCLSAGVHACVHVCVYACIIHKHLHTPTRWHTHANTKSHTQYLPHAPTHSCTCAHMYTRMQALTQTRTKSHTQHIRWCTVRTHMHKSMNHTPPHPARPPATPTSTLVGLSRKSCWIVRLSTKETIPLLLPSLHQARHNPAAKSQNSLFKKSNKTKQKWKCTWRIDVKETMTLNAAWRQKLSDEEGEGKLKGFIKYSFSVSCLKIGCFL